MSEDVTGFGATIGFVVGLVTWLILLRVAVGRFECLRFEVCGADDLMLAAAMGVGFALPSGLAACVAAVLASTIQRRR